MQMRPWAFPPEDWQLELLAPAPAGLAPAPRSLADRRHPPRLPHPCPRVPSPEAPVGGQVVTETASRAARGPHSAPVRASGAQECHAGPPAPSHGSHALRDRPAPPPGPAPSNPLRGRGRASRGPASRPPRGRGVSRARRVGAGGAGPGPGRGRGGRGPAPTGCRAPGRPGSVRGGGGGGGAGSWRRAVLLRRAHGRTGEPTLEAPGAGAGPAGDEREGEPRAASGRPRPPVSRGAPSARRCQCGAMGGSMPARAA
ncbi:hypothetical protein VULLAG_LOCUS4120 [Vulpes lagopus]